MSIAPEIVDELISLGGCKRWLLIRQADCLYFAGEDTWHRAESWPGGDRVSFDTHIGQHWVTGRVSDPFDTVEAARHDAIDGLPWFFEAQTSNKISS